MADAGTMADAPFASVAAVTVIVMRDGAPVPNVRTYFVPRNGVPPVTVDTDASGRAVTFMDLSVLLAGTASVTVVDPFPDEITSVPRFDHLRTVAGLRPNDQILVTEGSTRIVPVKAPVVPGADHYTVQATCGSGSLSGTQVATGSITLSCSATDLLVLAQQGSTLLKSLYHPGVTATAGQTIDLTGDSYQDPRPLAFAEAGLPPPTVPMDVAVGFSSPHGTIDNAIQGDAPVVNGAASGTLAVPAAPPIGRVVSVLALATSVSFPMLPGNVLPWTPVPTDSVSVTIFNEMTPLSYDLVRAHVFDNSGGAQLDLSGRTVMVGSGTN